MKNLAERWGPVLGWMSLIFFFSDVPGLPWLLPEESRDPVSTAAHFLEYSALGALLLRACLPDLPTLPGESSTGQAGRQAARPSRTPHRFWVLLALWTVASFYGAADEFHQSLVPNRTASVEDWAVDTSGALAGLVSYYLWKMRASLKRKRGV